MDSRFIWHAYDPPPRRRRTAVLLGATAALVAGIAAAAVTPARASTSVIYNSDACRQLTLAANDDESTPLTPMGFTANFFGQPYDQLFVNNNGNVTFNSPMSTFTPFGLTSNIGTSIIAPFFADVDTRGAGSGLVHYGNGGGAPWYIDSLGTHRAFCVDWGDTTGDGSLNGVGYYSSHTDKLNAFQLILVDRSDVTGTSGDFDIVFNYQSVQWETGDVSGGTNGFGGLSAHVGYSNGTGTAGTSAELVGSGVPGSFLDGNPDTGLANTSNSLSLPNGRYVFPVRNGSAPTGASISGTVTRQSDSNPIPDAPVQACPTAGVCRAGMTDSLGHYNIPYLADGTYTVTAFPPAGTQFTQTSRGGAYITGGGSLSGFDLQMAGPMPLPSGAVLTGAAGDFAGGQIPTIYWASDSTLTLPGCAGGTASFAVSVRNLSTGEWQTANGTLGETAPGSGVYTGTIPPLYPMHGSATVDITFNCPGPTTEYAAFTVYIDPSGTVVDMSDNPVAAATVVLLRSDSAVGPFSAVPNGSAIMSPANRNNPDTTTVTGVFGWDVIAGYYEVEALAPGCHAPGDPGQAAVFTGVLTIPPPVLGLTLQLDCSAGPTDTTKPAVDVATDPLVLEGNTTGGWTGTLTAALAGVSATDPDDASSSLAITNDAAMPLALGDTTVTWTATDPADNFGSAQQTVTVVDTTPPSITCPTAVTAVYGSPVSLGTPTVDDIVDASPTVGNNAPATFPAGVTSVTWTATDHSLNSATCTQSVTVHAPTSLLQNGQMIVNTNSSLLVGAQLSSPAAACRPGRTISFALDRNPVTGVVGAYSLGSATTDSSGQATRSVSTTSWQEGVYTVSASFAGTAGCDASGDPNGTVVVAGPGDSASGGGWYTLQGSGRSNFGFVVKKMPNGTYQGQALFINTNKWRLKGTLSSYSKSGTTGSANGLGTLYYWDQAANGGYGAWILSQSNVTFSMTFSDNGTSKKSAADTFGIIINHAVNSPPEPAQLPNSSPVSIKGGDIRVS